MPGAAGATSSKRAEGTEGEAVGFAAGGAGGRWPRAKTSCVDGLTNDESPIRA